MNVKELFDLSGKVAIVTGGARGLGYQMAEGLAEAGADVAVFDLDPKVDQLIKGLHETGRRVLPLVVDVTKRAEVVAAVEQVVKEFGRIDVLINDAGINDVHPIAPEGLETWEKIMAVNITGTFLCAGAVGKTMKHQKAGSIINISSIYGLVGLDKSLYVDELETFFEFPAYNASKGAVANFTRDLATNWGRYSIRANAICPATFVTDQNRHILAGNTLEKIRKRTPLCRTGGEDDLKGVAVFLASDASRYITGQTICVDGGWTAW